MARENNFLLGNGERLTYKTDPSHGGGDKHPPYDFDVAKAQVSRWLKNVTQTFSQLSSKACPNDEAVAVITMHPRYISKSDFPHDLLESNGLRAIGGRSRLVTPHAWGIERHPESAMTDEYFVAGKRDSFINWAQQIEDWTPRIRGAIHIQHLEQVSPFAGREKMRSIESQASDMVLEVVLHDSENQDLLVNFQDYAKTLGVEVMTQKYRTTRGLLFVPVKANESVVKELADFSFVRVIRPMPKLRLLRPSIIRAATSTDVDLPSMAPFTQSARVAIFDGGIPRESILNQWVTPIEPEGIGTRVPECEEHGIAVTSALLFGPMSADGGIPQPLCTADHIRVLDNVTGTHGDYEYYDVLDRILKVLDEPSKQYDFVNISLGPSLPIDDDEVTRWTSSLDERLVGDRTVTTVAAGNDGLRDAASGLNRIQPPSDGVNVLAIGAADRTFDEHWKRAPYSCVGPGRQPGFVKPDAVIFGGTQDNPFYVLAPGSRVSVHGLAGTSFAAPFALRTAVGIRAQLGSSVSALATRALMIHRADGGGYEQKDVGWGYLESDLSRIITCDDDETLVIFQDQLPLGQYLRAPIPVPKDRLAGYVTITATLVIAPDIDPSYPNSYTRGGLEVVFRPDATKYGADEDGKTSKHPKSKSFFSKKKMYRVPEYELRDDAHKWETCLKASQRFLGSKLNNPCFDIYYHHRGNSVALDNPRPIPYALIVSLKAPKIMDLYDQVVRTYANQLVQLRPQTRIQVQ